MRGVSGQSARPDRPPRPIASRASSTGLVFEQVSPPAPASSRDARQRQHHLAFRVGPEGRQLHEQRLRRASPERLDQLAQMTFVVPVAPP